MKDALVSIIIPAYNAENFIEQTIQSALSQAYDRIEVVVVNDGSSDNTRSICNRLLGAHHNLKLINQDNRGVSCARNKGIAASKGDFLFFLDSDDIIPPNAIKKLIDATKHTGVDIVSGKMIRGTDTSSLESHVASGTTVLSGGDPVDIFLHGNLGYSSCSRIYRRSVVKTEFDETIKINEDKKFLFDSLILSDNIACINDTTYIYRQRTDSVSHSGFSEKYLDIEIVANYIFKRVVITYPEKRGLALKSRNKSLLELYAHMTLSREARSKHKDKYKELRDDITRKNYVRLDGRTANLRLMLVKFAPVAFTVIAYIYNSIYLKKRRMR